MMAANLSQLAQSLQGPPPGYEAPGSGQDEILIRYDGHSLERNTPIIYALITVDHAARIPERLFGLLDMSEEKIDHGFFMQMRGEETLVFIDTEKHEKWIDKVIEALNANGVVCQSAIGDVALMCPDRGMKRLEGDAAREDVRPQAYPAFVELGFTYVDLEVGFERMAEARRQLEARRDAESPSL